MKTNRLVVLFLLLSGAAGFRLAGRANKAGHRTFQERRATAEAGDADSQVELGLRYNKGDGVAKDFAEAVKWFRKAAEQNHPRAQNALGVCYSEGEGVVKDPVEAVKWYRKAADQNYARGQNNLGICYEDGTG